MKVGVISNSLLGLQGIHYLISQQKIAGVTIPDRYNEANEIVKMICNQYSIPIQITHIENKSNDLQNWLQSIQPDAVIAAGCPFKIDDRYLSIPGAGFWNIHAGKLPEYAGPDPVFWQIRNRDKELIICVHKMTEKIDKGPVLLEIPMKISGEKTYGEVWQQLQQSGPNVFQQVLSKLESGSFKLQEQSPGSVSYSKRPSREDLIIDWGKMNADEIIALVNSSNPDYGGAIALFRGGYIRILRVKKISSEKNANPGKITKADYEGLWVQTKDNQLLSIEIASMAHGYLTGADLVQMDIRAGDQFDNPH